MDLLRRIGRVEQAGDIFGAMLDYRNYLGRFSDDVNPEAGELAGNFAQAYSMVGTINDATRLFNPREAMV